MKILILAGGKGSRLYPISTEQKPKQFLRLFNDEPMLITTIKRFSGFLDLSDIIIVTSKNYFDQTKEILAEYGMGSVNIINEPCGRNTLPAILLGVKYSLEFCCNADEPIVAIPSDHMISPVSEFIKTLNLCGEIAADNKIATIGIKPDRPDTGYGYIQALSGDAFSKTQKFTEKPELKTAEKYIAEGNYFWNSGIYAFTAAILISEVKKHCPQAYEIFQAHNFKGFLENFANLPSVSIDVGISEKSDKIYMAFTKMQWSDIGNWRNYYEHCPKDPDGNVLKGNVRALHCKNCLIAAFDGEITAAYQENQIIVNSDNKCVCIPFDKAQKLAGLS